MQGRHACAGAPPADLLPDKEIYDYLCTGCAAVALGQREVTMGEKHLQQQIARRQSRSAPARQLFLP